MLSIPTLFPSGRFGKSHPHDNAISVSEFAHLLNKDSRFRKDDQYVFYLLWQNEMREISTSVYNLLKSTRQHAMPVGEFVDRVSTSDEEVEGNLSTIFQQMRGSKQYWFLRCSEVMCMVREYSSPTFFLTLSCAEYDSLDIATYLRKVHDMPDSYPIGKICTEDPVSVSRKFSQKFHDFFQTVILKDKYWVVFLTTSLRKNIRHVGHHTITFLWIDGAPVAGTESDDEVLQWIQARITRREQ